MREAATPTHARRLTFFVGVGALNTFIDIGAFTCFYQLAGLNVVLSNVLAFVLAVTNSYVLNRLITFADRSRSGVLLRRFVRYFLIAVMAMIASTAVVYLVSRFTHPLAGKLIATVASTFINCVGSHRFVFTVEHKGAPLAD